MRLVCALLAVLAVLPPLPTRSPLALLAPLAPLAPLAAIPAAGQERTPPRRGMDRRALEERLRARFGAMVADELGLDRQTQEALARTVRSFDGERRELQRRREALERQRGQRISLREAAAPGRSVPLLPDREALALLEELRTLRSEEHELLLREQEALLEILTPGQVMRFLTLREALAERVRRLRFGPPGPGMRPGGGRER